MGAIARLVSFVICIGLAATLLILAAASMAAIAAERALAASTYQQVLAEHRVYERLPDVIGAQLSLQVSYEGRDAGEGEGPSGGAPAIVKELTAAQWSELVTELLPPGWLAAQTDALLVGLLGDPPATEVRIDLATLREHLRGGAALRSYRIVAQALPPCDSAAGEPFDLARLGSCRPLIGVGGDLTEAEFDLAVAEELAKMPDFTTVTLPAEIGGGEPGAGRLGVGTIRTWRASLALAPLAPAVVLLLLVRHRAALRWIGVPFLVAGTVIFSAGLAAESMLPALEAVARGRVPDYWSAAMADAVFDVGTALGRSMLDAVVLAAGAGVLLGLALFAASMPLRARAA